MSESEGSPLVIDRARVLSCCQQEWKEFVKESTSRPIPERQDQRGFLLNWVAVFLPEAFPQELISDMRSFVEDSVLDSDPLSWNIPLLIQTALFALNGSWGTYQTHLTYFDYGGSSERSFLHKTLALVAPTINFDSELTGRLERCLSIPFFDMDYGLALYGVSQGPKDVKLANLKRWREAFFMNASEAEIVERFLKGDPALNPFAGYLLRNTAYVALRLGSEQSVSDPSDSLNLGYALHDVWTRVDQHPLFARYFELRGD